MAKKFAVLGSPISHSLSPVIHKAAYAKLGLIWEYSSFEVTELTFNDFLDSKTEIFSGFSVTMPLKEIAFNYAKQSSSRSSLTGLANTLVKVDGEWCAYNTDVFGLSQALNRNFDGMINRVLLVGTGATAKSAVMACIDSNPNVTIEVIGRNPTNIDRLVEFGLSIGANIVAKEPTSSNFDLTISTIPAQAWANFITAVQVDSSCGTLFDVAYNPWPSAAAETWQKFSGNTVSGIQMLIWQAIAQIRLFLYGDESVSLEREEDLAFVMLDAANAALK